MCVYIYIYKENKYKKVHSSQSTFLPIPDLFIVTEILGEKLITGEKLDKNIRI